MPNWTDAWFTRFYFSRSNWENGTEAFIKMICRNSSANRTLEVGCGPSNDFSRLLKTTVRELDGLDVDPMAGSNDALNHFFLAKDAWPIADNSYDTIIANYVLEHVQDTKAFVSELYRVLQPGGVFVFRTPNIWHPLCLFSRFTPFFLHKFAAKAAKTDTGGNVYPTFYHMNSRRRNRNLFCKEDFPFEEMETLLIEKEPSYARRSRLLFILMLAYERTVNASSHLSNFRVNIFSAFRKIDPSHLHDKGSA